MNDPKQYEKETFIEGINGINSIIEELQKLYEKTPPTDRFARVRILSGMKRSKRELAKTLAEYDKFKKYKDKNGNKQITNLFIIVIYWPICCHIIEN
jgi:hypothetical protein